LTFFKVGFTDDSGGLVIALNPNNGSHGTETGQNADIEAVVTIEHMDEEAKKQGKISNSAKKNFGNLLLIFISLTIFALREIMCL
jgi:hypothetical protein